MSIDYSDFTAVSRNAITKSLAIARQCKYKTVEPQLMMAAMIQEGQDVVPFLLSRMGIDKTVFCQAVSVALRLIQHQDNCEPDFAQSLDRILKRSIKLSKNDGNNFVSLEYIFWAFVEIDNPIRDIFRQFEVNSTDVKRAIDEYRQNARNQESQDDTDDDSLPFLNRYGRNLIKSVNRGEIEPVIGRDNEIRIILEIISRKTKNNPILVGEPGTGKTAVVEGLAHRIAKGEVPQELQDLKLYLLDLTSLIAGASMQGEFEQRLKNVIHEVESNPNIILFIDEIHLIIGTGRSSGAMDAANILKPELARGVLKIIGATTLDEYRKYIEKDKAFERRFQRVLIEEPDEESAIAIIRGIKSRFEAHHHVKILDDAVVASVKLSHRYIQNRFLPDKAIDLIDQAASSMKIDRASAPHELEVLIHQIRTKEIERESLIQDGNPLLSDVITNLNIEIADLKEKERTLNAKWQNERQQLGDIQNLNSQLQKIGINIEVAEQQERYSDVVELKRQEAVLRDQIDAKANEINATDNHLLKSALDEEDIMKVVTAMTGIPMTTMTQDENEKLLHIEEALHGSVIGQEEAIKAVSDAIRRSRIGFSDAGKPIGTFLFLGSTGVGKTELCKALADYLFNSRDMIIRIDMSEYQQEYSVSKLFGAPPGYVGYDEGGQLTEAVRRKPYSVVLFDEIEKAHQKVFETLLQVLDDGRMTDGQGRIVDFKNTLIIMTSNIGQTIINNYYTTSPMSDELSEMIKEQVICSLKERVAPEFINRIDDIVVFTPLSRDDIKRIVVLQLSAFQKKVKQNDIDIVFDDSAVSFIAQKSYKPEYGGRPVKRAIKDYVMDKLSLLILNQNINKDSQIIVSAREDGLSFSNN